MNSTPSYTAPTLHLSSNLSSTALLVSFADKTSVPGPHTPYFNKPIFSSALPPLKLLRKYDKAWTRSTSTMFTQLIYSVQSHFLKHQPSASHGPVTSLPCSLASPPPEDTQCQVCQSPFDEEKMLLCDICNAGWHIECLLPPLTGMPFQLGCGNAPCAPLLSHPRVHCDTSASPSRSLTLTLIKHRLESNKKHEKKIPTLPFQK